MKANFDACMAEVFRHEGGYVDHPDDPGGATNYGITRATLAKWRGHPVTKSDVRSMVRGEAAKIYRMNYWDAVQGDDLPAGLDLVAFDAAVNSGPARGARWLQQALGVPADGRIGPVTLSAAERKHVPGVILHAIRLRLAFMQGLPTWKTFGRGWANRVAAVEKAALAMAGDDMPHRPDVEPLPAKPRRDNLAWFWEVIAGYARLFARKWK